MCFILVIADRYFIIIVLSMITPRSEELPNLQDEVTIVGYPIGGDNACVTVGVVSRIDMQRYNVPCLRHASHRNHAKQ